MPNSKGARAPGMGQKLSKTNRDHFSIKKIRTAID